MFSNAEEKDSEVIQQGQKYQIINRYPVNQQLVYLSL